MYMNIRVYIKQRYMNTYMYMKIHVYMNIRIHIDIPLILNQRRRCRRTK